MDEEGFMYYLVDAEDLYELRIDAAEHISVPRKSYVFINNNAVGAVDVLGMLKLEKVCSEFNGKCTKKDAKKKRTKTDVSEWCLKPTSACTKCGKNDGMWGKVDCMWTCKKRSWGRKWQNSRYVYILTKKTPRTLWNLDLRSMCSCKVKPL